MKPLAPLLLAFALILFTPISWAQTQPPAGPPSGQNTPPEHGPNSGTAPGGRGSSGWTGGSRTGADDMNTGMNTGRREPGYEPPDINADTEYATGEDLQGPPVHFPANRTPE